MDVSVENSSKTTRTGLAGRATQISADCLNVANALAIRATRQIAIRNLVRSLNLFIGFVAALVALSPDIREVAGPHLSNAISAIAAAVLLLGTLYFTFLSSDPPERYRDYALYIRMYSDHIEQLAALSHQSDNSAKLEVILELAALNLSDVSVRWPNVMPARS